MNRVLLKGAVINGVINAVINGGIQWFTFKKYEQVPISVDSITNDVVTVLGNGVHLSITLAMVLTFVAYFSIPKDRRPSWGKLTWLIVKHGFFTFGVVTGLSVLWQRYAGTVEVSPLAATFIVGLIAGAVAMVVNYLTLEPYAAR